MPGVYRDVGIALRTVKLGEADRIVTFVTEGPGRCGPWPRASGNQTLRGPEPPTHVAPSWGRAVSSTWSPGADPSTLGVRTDLTADPVQRAAEAWTP